jgi:hypothetical protein
MLPAGSPSGHQSFSPLSPFRRSASFMHKNMLWGHLYTYVHLARDIPT